MKTRNTMITMILTGVLAVSVMASASAVTAEEAQEGATYTIGICNYVDDASLNQIVENIEDRLQEIGEEEGVSFEISYDNCNADAKCAFPDCCQF